ncbi:MULTISPECIES: hypothetical protein [Kitasatospora]|uniref:hypothetical protein n=1 Tax=Kitasatospora TaxID=2063 RepID=UPI000CC6D91C|nr:hypothetical protein [Kitasatospora sp. GP30]MDH6141393.1 hypothetical protein [Kitasatospora sp. GP30]
MSAATPEVDPQAPGGHLAEVTERGSFAFAACSCGWFAPARRSRDKARRDVAEHLESLQQG